MGVKQAVVVGAVGVAAGLVARTVVRERRESAGDGRHPEGWKAVTILGDPELFDDGGYPAPLERLRGAVEVRIAPAPGDKGFEVHARLRDGAEVDGDDPDQALRTALRDAKQIVETGEVLKAKPRPHGHRSVSLLGAVVDKAEDDAKGEGVL